MVTILNSNLKGHELVVRLRCPRVYLDTVLQCNNEELYSLIFHCKSTTQNDYTV